MTDANTPPLARAIAILGNQTKLAEAVGRKQQSVNEVVRRGSRVPAEWCPLIEKATGGKVTRHQLRPDLFGNMARA